MTVSGIGKIAQGRGRVHERARPVRAGAAAARFTAYLAQLLADMRRSLL